MAWNPSVTGLQRVKLSTYLPQADSWTEGFPNQRGLNTGALISGDATRRVWFSKNWSIALGDTLHQLATFAVRNHCGDVIVIGHEAHFQQRRGHVGAQQNVEALLPVRILQRRPAGLGNRVGQHLRKPGRLVLRFALHQVGEDAVHLFRPAGVDLDIEDPVILPARAVDALLALRRQRVDRRAAGRWLGSGVGVQRDEQVSAQIARLGRPGPPVR